MPNVGTATFTDAQKKRSTVRVDMLVDETAWDTLRGVIEGLSDAQVARRSYLVTTYPPVTAQAGNVDRKAIVTAQDENGHVHKWAIPAFNGASDFDNIGEKVEDAELETVVTAFQTATTYTKLLPLRSPVIQTR